mgnify:CR=1 FL=1
MYMSGPPIAHPRTPVANQGPGVRITVHPEQLYSMLRKWVGPCFRTPPRAVPIWVLPERWPPTSAQHVQKRVARLERYLALGPKLA